MADIIQAVQKTVMKTMGDSKPSGVYYGVVISVSPLKINIDQKLVLTEEFIVLGRYITEFSTDYMIEGETWHGLRKNDELLLIREQGGQRYYVVDWVKRVEEDTRPAWVMTGEVISAAPEIKVNAYLTLRPENLILCRNVTEYAVDMSVSHITEKRSGGSGDPAYESHDHDYKDRKKFLVHNALVPGDRVLLVCARSEQKWYVVDFIYRNQGEVRGQWL